MSYTDEEIDVIRREAKEACLYSSDLLTRQPYDVIRAHCNGIGCKSLPKWVVNTLNVLLPSAVVPSDIHDLRFHFGDGTANDFREANYELGENIRLMAKYRYKHWYQWLTRRKLCRIADIVRTVCDNHGWSAYLAAIQERKAEGSVSASDTAKTAE